MTKRQEATTCRTSYLEKPRGALLVLGAFLVFLPSGVFMYWGNMSVYVNSYLVHNVTTIHQNKFPAPWIISTFLVCNNLGITSGGLIANQIGRRQTALFAVFLFSSGLFLTSVAIRHSLSATCSSFGMLTGLGSGLLYASVIADVIDCGGKRVGFITQAVTTGYNIGAVITNQYVTFYVNPQNDDVDSTIDSISYFSQESILTSIPRMFVILGFYTLLLQMSGLLSIHIYFYLRKNTIPTEDNMVAKSLLKNTESRDYDDLDSDTDSSCGLIEGDRHNTGDGEEDKEEFIQENVISVKRKFGSQNRYRVKTSYRLVSDSRQVISLRNNNTHLSSDGGHSRNGEKDACDNTIPVMATRLNREDMGDNSIVSVQTGGGITTTARLERGTDQTGGGITTTARHERGTDLETGVLPDYSDSDVLDIPRNNNNNNTNYTAKINETIDPLSKAMVEDNRKEIEIEKPPNKKLHSSVTTTIANHEVSPRLLFCFKSAYAILSIILAKHISFNLLSNYYKTLGENYIHNDQFLATLGSLLSLVSIPAKPAIGWIVDRFGIRTPTIIALVSLCINSAVYPATPKIGKWVFLVCSIFYELSICAVNACCSLGTLLCLGRRHFTTNYGLLATATILLDLIAPVVIPPVLVLYGWQALFSGASVAVLVSLVMTVLFLR